METSGEKTGISLNILAAVLKLDKLQIRAIFTGVLGKPQPNPAVALNELDLFFLFTANMLHRMVGLKTEQQHLILSELHAANIFSIPHLRQLIIIDGQYFTWTGRAGFLCLQTGEEVATLPDNPVETIGYNLDELYRRGIALAEKNVNHVKKNNAGSVEES